MIFQHNQIKKNIKALTLTFLLTCTAQAEPPQNKKDLTHEFTVGLESFKYHYGEQTPKQKNFMQLNGMMYGVNGAYQLTYRATFFIRPEVRWAYGHTDYTAGKLGEQHKRDQIPSMIFEPRLLVGIPFQTTKQLILSPYSGIGWRYKKDDWSDIFDKRHIPGLKRINQSWYIPLGSRFHYNLDDRWNLQGFLEYNWFIRGRQSSYHKDFEAVSNAGNPYRRERIPSTLIFKQKEGWGAKAELLVGYRFDKIAVAFGPYMHYLHIQTSSPASYFVRHYRYNIVPRVLNFPKGDGYEPNNTTKEIGLKVNFYF